MEQSQYGIAAELLRITAIEALRKETRRNRHWASIYAGFRANSLTRPLFLRGARAFAANSAEHLRLCNVFLDSLGVADGKDLAARFAEAGKLSGLDEQTRALCSLLATTDLRSLPRFMDAADGPPVGPNQETESAGTGAEKEPPDQAGTSPSEAPRQGPV